MTYHLFFSSSDICEAIHVTGDNSTSNSEGGLYLPTDKRALGAPNSPVWRNSAGTRFIFTDGNSNGQRIGQESGLTTTGNYFCKSKQIFIIFTFASTYIFRIFMCINHLQVDQIHCQLVHQRNGVHPKIVEVMGQYRSNAPKSMVSNLKRLKSS